MLGNEDSGTFKMLALKKGKLSGQLSSDDWPLWRNTFLEMIEAMRLEVD
jgi:hypothetical protein